MLRYKEEYVDLEGTKNESSHLKDRMGESLDKRPDRDNSYRVSGVLTPSCKHWKVPTDSKQGVCDQTTLRKTIQSGLKKDQSGRGWQQPGEVLVACFPEGEVICLLYTSDAADARYVV